MATNMEFERTIVDRQPTNKVSSLYSADHLPQLGDADYKADEVSGEIPQKALIASNLQKKLADFVQIIQSKVEVRGNGLPLYYVDASALLDIIPSCDSVEDISQTVYDNCLVPIEIESQGLISVITGGMGAANFPCVKGVPIWERLDGEPIEYYRLFQEYRDMKYVQESRYNSRSMARISEALNQNAVAMMLVSKIFHWALRVRWYDVYREMDFQLKRQREIEYMESQHAKISKDLVDRAMKYLEDHPKEITPKVAVSMLELGLRYGRISLGLLGDKPGGQAASSGNSNPGGGPGSSPLVNIAVASVNNGGAQSSAISVTTGDTQGQVTEDKSEVERALANRMKNPETIVQVLHILQRTGAMTQAVQDLQNNGHKDAGLVPVDENGEPLDTAGMDDDEDTIEGTATVVNGNGNGNGNNKSNSSKTVSGVMPSVVT